MSDRIKSVSVATLMAALLWIPLTWAIWSLDHVAVPAAIGTVALLAFAYYNDNE